MATAPRTKIDRAWQRWRPLGQPASGECAHAVEGSLHRAGTDQAAQCVRRDETGTHSIRNHPEMIARDGRNAFRDGARAPPAQRLDQHAGFDADRTRGGAQTAGSARVDAVEAVQRMHLLEVHAGLTRVLETCDLAPTNDALARRQRQLVGRTLGFAKTALDALVDDRIAFRQRLQILQMCVAIVVDDHAWIQQTLWIE